jgi:hypothetical protein
MEQLQMRNIASLKISILFKYADERGFTLITKLIISRLETYRINNCIDGVSCMKIAAKTSNNLRTKKIVVNQ